MEQTPKRVPFDDARLFTYFDRVFPGKVRGGYGAADLRSTDSSRDNGVEKLRDYEEAKEI